MAIDSISFGKGLFKRANKKENENNKNVQIPEQLSKNDRASLKGIAPYLAAALLMTGSMTSCIEQDQVTDVDVQTDEMLKLMQEMLKAQNETNKYMQQVMELLQNNNTQNADMIKLLQNIMKQNQEITSILTGIGTDVSQIASAVLKISALMEESNKNDQELLNKIDIIIAGQGSDSDKLQQLIDLNTEQNKWLTNIFSLIETLQGTNSDLSETIKNFYNDYKNDMNDFKNNDKDHTELMNKILNTLLSSNEISSDILAQIKQIQQSGQADSAKLDAIIKLLESIDQKLGKIEVAIEDLGDNMTVDGQKLADLMQQLIDDHKAGKVQDKEMMQQMIDLMNKSIDNDNENNGAILKVLAEISEKISSGQMDYQEGFDKLADILNQINGNLNNISTQLSGISAQIDKLLAGMNSNHEETLEMLSKLFDKTSSIDNKLTQIEKNQQEGNKTLVDISQKLDEANSSLNQINSKMITIDQLKDMFGPMFNEIIGKLDVIGGNQIDIDQLEEVLAKYQTDLTKTNGLIENLTAVVKDLNLSVDMGPEFQKVIDAINDFKNQEAASAEEQMQAYRDIMEQISKLNNSVDALGATANNISNDLKAHMNNATTFGTKMVDAMEQVIKGQADSKAAMETYANEYKAYLVQAEQDRMQQIALLQAIVDKEVGGNGGGLTKEELEDVLSNMNINIPDYADILQEISDKIGKVITSDDLQNFFIKTQPDLTKTNALIENLTAVLKDKNFTITGDLSVEMTEVENLLGKVYDLINNQQTPTNDQIKALISLATQIAENTKQQGGTTASVKTRTASEMDRLYAAINRLSVEAAKSQGKGATYHTHAGMFTFNA
ncbi:MAG TPA: hypothetical protein IAD26_06355 [Candidatus Limenecus avicola]|uniref:Uncharacterized protein n=1 Tax=Candidatus Limenecus avicola TaxID=2840847 RepID=A0A9D1SRR1_9CLOT|nr:hypothetical protein [Candidatus Limenecus avicola]